MEKYQEKYPSPRLNEYLRKYQDPYMHDLGANSREQETRVKYKSVGREY